MVRVTLLLPSLMLAVTAMLPAQEQTPPPSASTYTLKVTSDLVLTNVVVRDRKTGQLVRGLKKEDFSLLEDGRPQQITSFDIEDVDQAAQLAEATVAGRAGERVVLGAGGTVSPEQMRNHRLIVMFFDTTSLQPDDLVCVQDAARDFVTRKMQPADLVAAVSLGSNLQVDQDFTQDKQLLLKAVNSYGGDSNQGYVPGATATTNQVEDTTSFTADETEYNDINTDRELYAISTIAKSLAYINEKKSMLYFSGGIQRDGIENQASIRAAVNSAVRANLSIYSVDARGLQAISPLGDASTGSLRGNAAFSGAALQNNLDSNFNSQEVMATLSSDTGGKAFFDSNDFSPAFEQVQRDSSSYYVLGFHSTNLVRDGRFRKLQIRVDRPDVKLEYRPGYYAPADYKHANSEERERQLEAELSTDLPSTDVSVYLQALYFRVDRDHYSVPISILVPGSQIPFTKGGDRDKATLDIIGQVKDSSGRIIGNARDTVKLAIDASQQVSRKNIQYSTGFTLPPGKFELKFVVRENETGKMGSFDTTIDVPDLSKLPLKMSSVVLASQRVPAPKKTDSLLVRDGLQFVPNLPHVFRPDQSLFFLYEVYDPARITAGKAGPVHLLTSIEFLRGTVKVFETQLVEAKAINVAGRDAVAFQFTVPLTSLKDGMYTCQVNVIDDAGGSFRFPRLALLIRSGTPAAAASGVQ